MVFTFARVGAATGMKVEDYFIQASGDDADGFACMKRAANAMTCRRIITLKNI
jgi:hypothetical protein